GRGGLGVLVDLGGDAVVDRARRANDVLSRRADQRAVGSAPAADVADAVVGRVEPEQAADDERDRLGFGLAGAALGGLRARAVQHRVSGLVDRGLGLLRRLHVGVDDDAAGPVGAAVLG